MLATLDDNVRTTVGEATVQAELTMEQAALLHPYSSRANIPDPRANMVWENKVKTIGPYTNYEDLQEFLETMDSTLIEHGSRIITRTTQLSDQEYRETMQWIANNMTEQEDALDPRGITWPSTLNLPDETEQARELANKLRIAINPPAQCPWVPLERPTSARTPRRSRSDKIKP